MVTRDTPWVEWAASFPVRGADCVEGNAWAASVTEGVTCEEALVFAAEDPAFCIGWASWAVVTYYGEIDARIRGLLFGVIRKKPMIAAILYRDHRRAFGDVDRKRCLMAFHGRFRSDKRQVLPTVEDEIEVTDG